MSVAHLGSLKQRGSSLYNPARGSEAAPARALTTAPSARDAAAAPSAASTYATWLSKDGIRDELIQRCMGQAPTSVLDKHYRKWTDEDLIHHVEQEYAPARDVDVGLPGLFGRLYEPMEENHPTCHFQPHQPRWSVEFDLPLFV